MSKEFGNPSSDIEGYVKELFWTEDELLRNVLRECREAGLPDIQVSELDARHLEVLARLVRARKAVEIGTLGGYSGIFLLRGMESEGHLYTFEFSPLHAQVAHRNFKMAKFDRQVTQYVGAALENLPTIEPEGPFDLVFIDADKGNYPMYLEWAERNLRVGGVVIGDNTFAFGKISEVGKVNELAPSVKALHQFNSHLAKSPHFCTTIFPTGEGLTVGVKLSHP
ncbi:MAG: O-methyltransferase [Bdellovibrionales bacterium]|nr:O-methyltransferase [Bdellovibrionales bacterium]